MPAKRNIMPEEVRNAKLLLSKGLPDAEVAAIIGRSVSAVINIRNGAYDFMLADVPNDTPDDSRVCILLKSIDSRLYQQNEDMKKAIDQLVVLNSALVELQNEIKVCSSCMTAMLDALNELKSKNSQQAEQETTPTKYPGKNFANWGEVIRRVEVYGDKFIADNLRGTKASLDGVTLYLACTPSTKKFLKSSAVAIPRIKQQCRNVIGYGVEVKIIDPKPTQAIQPYEYGHPYSKKTLLWERGVPPLHPTNIVEPTATWCPSGSYSHKHGEQHKGMFTTDRAKNRAKTFPGVAKAMSEQWG